jgi:LytS/YehU family sensor histidine kinase
LDMMISRNIFPFLLSLGVAVAIRATVKSNKEESERKKLENEHLKSELSYLKYQIQPHFFFNTLNNIYSLIDTSPDYAKEVLHRLSKLMRFILYQTNDSEVLVKDEITFIANYVELMKIRTQQNVSISIEIPPTVPEVRIPPLIYISLVENAFKHGIDPVKNSVIRIWFSVANDKLLFEVANTNFPKAQKDKSGSGIGVANVKKRLEFLYSPDEYNFEQQCVGDFYITKLTIPINHG